MEDDAIARGFAARETWAYEAAYRIHGTLLVAAAQQVLRDRQEAQDCVHDTLLHLWQRGGAYAVQRGTLRAFLAVCVRNEALSRSRKRRNRERIAAGAPPDPSHQSSVEERVMQSATVAGALDALSEKQREPIVLSYYGGFTLAEIAERLGEPVGTVKSRLSAGLRRMRELFSDEENRHART